MIIRLGHHKVKSLRKARSFCHSKIKSGLDLSEFVIIETRIQVNKRAFGHISLNKQELFQALTCAVFLVVLVLLFLLLPATFSQLKAQVTAPDITNFNSIRTKSLVLPDNKPQQFARANVGAVTVGASGNFGASFVIPEPEPTGLLATEPLGLESLGEGAEIISNPQGLSAQELLALYLEGMLGEDSAESQQGQNGDLAAASAQGTLLENTGIKRIGSIERLERERIRQAIAYAAAQRDPPIYFSMAQLQALDKITARITTLDIPVGQVGSIGTLDIRVDSCQKTPPSEPPDFAVHLNIQDRTVQAETYQAFAGWMLRSSPALSAMDHPIYDVWVIKCYGDEISPEVNRAALAAAGQQGFVRSEATSASSEEDRGESRAGQSEQAVVNNSTNSNATQEQQSKQELKNQSSFTSNPLQSMANELDSNWFFGDE